MERLVAKLAAVVIAVSIVATFFAPVMAAAPAGEQTSAEVSEHGQGLVQVLVVGAAAQRAK